jgi:hypothetical protein
MNEFTDENREQPPWHFQPEWFRVTLKVEQILESIAQDVE